MATTVTFNGSTYSVPALGDSGWAIGPGNLSAYLIAIASGTLQTTGGSFTLSAPLDFGTTFGLFAAYYTTKTASPATSGVFRLALSDTIAWGPSNLALSTSGGNLFWNGVQIPVGSISLPIAIASGGTGQTTQQAALDALSGSQTNRFYLRSDGTHVSMSAIQAADVPTLNQNTTGNADTATLAASATTATTATSATTATNLAGGAASQIPYQTGSGATAFVPNGTSGQILTSNGTSAPGWTNASGSFPPVSTRQVFLSGSSATYTTPASVRQLKIRMVGGGGGGGATATNSGSDGGDSSFNSIVAKGGKGGSVGSTNAPAGGAGGSGGSGSASVRISGSGGGAGSYGGGSTGNPAPCGGASPFGGAGGGAGISTTGQNAAANSGSGGGGSANVTGIDGAGGGSGEYVELIINSPAASYTYTVGASGTGGAAGTQAGGNGGSGIIIVDEYY